MDVVILKTQTTTTNNNVVYRINPVTFHHSAQIIVDMIQTCML